jgi:hypothetical protein
VNNCFGRDHLPRWINEEYSKTDGVHPWGVKGVPFIGISAAYSRFDSLILLYEGDVLFAWWQRYESAHAEFDLAHNLDIMKSIEIMDSDKLKELTRTPKKPLYVDKPIGICTRCDALVSDAEYRLDPIEKKGFRIITRMKVGFGGFNPKDRNSSTKSFKRSWQADKPGSTISFRFYGSSVKVALWQRRDGMGILLATVDGDESRVAKASGFFKGYTWAMDRNNTGRSEILPLFEGLEDKAHVIKFTVSDEPANVWVKGHTVQIFALLSASDNPNCKAIKL